MQLNGGGRRSAAVLVLLLYTLTSGLSAAVCATAEEPDVSDRAEGYGIDPVRLGATPALKSDDDSCDITGSWKHSRGEVYNVTQTSPGRYVAQWCSSCAHCSWTKGLLTVAGQRVAAAYDCKLGNRTGTLATDCKSVAWSDHTTWARPGAPPAPPPPPPPPPPGAVDPATIHTVMVMQSCHLDVGFADFSSNIINRFFHQHFPLAIETAAQLRQQNGSEALVFAVHPMLLSLFFDCPADFPHSAPGAGFTHTIAAMTPPQPLLCPNATQIAAVRQAIADGVIVFDAFPLSSQPELYTAPVFTAGLDLVTKLAASLNASRPRTLSQRDVPGMSRGVVPLLAEAGIHTISVGANGGSASPDLPGYAMSRAGALSTPFVWRDPESDSSVIAHWHPGGYGRLVTESGEDPISSCIGTSALPGVAMCLAFRGDNEGPPKPAEVTANWKQIAKSFPNATSIKAASFDTYFELLQEPAVRKKLPVVEAEVGDSWLYGAASDPLKVAVMRLFMRHHAACVKRTGCVASEHGFSNFTRLLLLVGKHTWGGHTLEVGDTTHYTAEQLREVRWSQPDFIVQELSWDEQRLELWAVRKVLGASSALGKAIDVELAQLHGPAAMLPLVPDDATGWTEVPQQQWAKSSTLGMLDVALDATTGAIVGLSTGSSGKQWAGTAHPLARFAYATHDAAQAETFNQRYFFRGPKPCGWCGYAFGKEGLTDAVANASVSHGTVVRMWKRGSEALAYELSIAPQLSEHYGAPTSVFVELSSAPQSSDSAQLNITLRMMNKTTTRLPESIWMEFRPDVPSSSELRLTKMNSSIDVADMVANGTSLHNTDEGGVPFLEGGAETLRVVGVDTGLVAVGPSGKTLNLWDYQDQRYDLDAADGVAFNLFNNLWTTNYIYWYPWRNATATEDDSTITYRWSVSVEAS